jgi:CSLREA domain-containing protein/uncharacterized repeat protein (TIGR01451 family)
LRLIEQGYFMQRFKAVVSRRVVLAILAASLAALAGAGTANAASFTVTTTADSSDGACTATLCSLRDAVEAADAAGGSSTITLPPGAYKLTIEPTGTAFDPTQGDLDIINDAHVTVNGAGQASTTIDANSVDRAFTVDDGAGLSLSDLTIANGQPGTDTGGQCSGCGGGVWSEGALAVSNVTITSSNGNLAGGAIFSGDDPGSTLSVTDSTFTFDSGELGGALATGPSELTKITGSTFSSNVAFEQGGALQNENGALSIDSSTFSGNVSGQSGGAIEELADNSPLTVTNSSFTNNSSTSAAGVIEDVDSSNLTLANSRFAGNTAEASGVLDVIAADGTVTLNGDEFDQNNAAQNGAITVFQLESLTATNSSFIGNHGGFGAALEMDTGTLSLTNVTMTHNSSPTIGGALLFNAGGTLPVSLTNVTIADNSAAPGGGGGITDASQMGTGSGATGVRNTIIANNTGGDCGVWDAASASAPVPAGVDRGFNLDSDSTCFKGDEATDKVGVDPLLGPPADNGGSVLTDALQPGSPAIDAGTDTGCPASDARGVSRPQGASCDMGAYEFAAAGLALSKSAPATATTGVPFTYTFTVTNNGPGPSTDTTVTDQLPTGSTLFGSTASQGTCSASGSPAKVKCSLGLVPNGANATVTIVAAVSAPGTATNTAMATNGEGATASATSDTVVSGVPGGARAPKATTAAASAIGKHGVTLNGHINSGGQPTAYFFQYGKTSSLGNITTVRHAPSSVSVADTVSHLSPGTVYHYRLVAVNDSGSSKGSVRKFKTTGPGGALRLDGTKLEVSARTVTATFTCASKKACSGSVTITVRLASKTAVLARGSLGRIRAGKRRSVSLSVRSGGLALLAKAPKQRLAGRLSARLGSGQRGVDRAVIVTLT